MNEPCWGFHCQAVPAATDSVIDAQDRRWWRAGPRSWRLATELDQPARFHESWLLGEYGPVRCAVEDEFLERRDTKLLDLLVIDGAWAFLPDQTAGDEPLVVEDALMLMRAGWLAWGPKQRREVLGSLRETEQRELAVTS